MTRPLFGILLLLAATSASAQTLQPVVPPELRGSIDAERLGTHDANRIRTRFYDYGMVGDYPPDPIGVNLSTFHSVEVPKGSGVNYSDGITPFVLARIRDADGTTRFIMQTGFRERQGTSSRTGRIMRFEPRPGYAEPDPAINVGRSVAISNDPRTWPGGTTGTTNPDECWRDKAGDAADPGWCGSWNGFFGKQPNADQESYFVMDDDLYDAFNFYPDTRDSTRQGLGLRVEVRGFQWSNPQASDVIFWHYDIVNEGTTQYEDILFGLYMDSGVGGSAISCDGLAESDDDNAFYDNSLGLNLVYTYDNRGRGVGLGTNCAPTGYLGYAYLETPGNADNGVNNDGDGITDERRDSGPGRQIVGQAAIRAHVLANYNLALFEAKFGPLEDRPAYLAGVWWTGDEDMDWVAALHDTGVDGVKGTNDEGEGDGIPTAGERNFDQTDVDESDQIGLTGFKMNRINSASGQGPVDGIVFFDDGRAWPQRLFTQFTAERPSDRFDAPLVLNYNIGFFFASGPFRLEAGRRERFSLALAYGADLGELRTNVRVVQRIYDANYQFATPPPTPTLTAYAGDGFVRLAWDNAAETSIDPVTNLNDFEGYRIYRSTDPNFLDAQTVTNATGTGPFGNGRPIAQFDLKNDITGFSNITVQGVAYNFGSDTGLTHTFTDSTVTNGQTYYYAVTSYDTGSEALGFYPSENSISVSRTTRGGTVLPPNVVQVRPNAEVPGFTAASVVEESVERSTVGVGSLDVRVVNPLLLRDGDRYRVEFQGLADSVRATTYSLVNETTGEVLIEGATDLTGSGDAPTGGGLLPVITTIQRPEVDTLASGFQNGAAPLRITYRYDNTLPANLRRPGYPEDFRVEFSDVFVDTSIAAIGAPARPLKFRVVTASGQRLKVRFRDLSTADRPLDNTLSGAGEFIEVLTARPATPNTRVPTWRLTVESGSGAPPAGSRFDVKVRLPFVAGDRFTFAVRGSTIDADSARSAFDENPPYVVPNPYVAAAAFEPERFAVSGRGERRIEFRAIPAGARIRIFTVRGELVQSLVQDGGSAGIVAWDLRSRDNLEVAPGLYIYHVEADGVGEHTGKFAIIK